MRLVVRIPGSGRGGFSLVLVMAFMAVSFFVISGVLYSTSNAAFQGQRHEDYYRTQEAATAGAEKVVASMLDDLQSGGRVAVAASLGTYPSELPTVAECPEWSNYQFRLNVARVQPTSVTELTWKYRGLSVTNDVYLIQAGAQRLDGENPMTSVVEQEIQVAEIPLFSFMAFSEFDLTFITPPGNNVTLGGRVHANRGIYNHPSGEFVFGDHVTAAGEIRYAQHPVDTAVRQEGSVSYLREADSQANTMRLAPGLVDGHFLLDVPPGTEAPGSILGRQRLFNQADLIVLVTNSAVAVSGGGILLPDNVWTNFIRTGASFYDKRELKEVFVTEFDIGALMIPTNYTAVRSVIGKNPRLIYLADIGYYTTETLGAIRVMNGQILPDGGLTIATPNPLYIWGHYNAPSPGTTDTSLTKPAMIAADAVTVLSAGWNDVNSNGPRSGRVAQSTTVNAAILAGTVPSNTAVWVFDGGWFNGLRLLEDWLGQTFTFNGAVITLFASQSATEPWRSDAEIYFAPTRQFSYDTNLLDWSRVPTGAPVLHTLIRGERVQLPPSTLF